MRLKDEEIKEKGPWCTSPIPAHWRTIADAGYERGCWDTQKWLKEWASEHGFTDEAEQAAGALHDYLISQGITSPNSHISVGANMGTGVEDSNITDSEIINLFRYR